MVGTTNEKAMNLRLSLETFQKNDWVITVKTPVRTTVVISVITAAVISEITNRVITVITGRVIT